MTLFVFETELCHLLQFSGGRSLAGFSGASSGASIVGSSGTSVSGGFSWIFLDLQTTFSLEVEAPRLALGKPCVCLVELKAIDWSVLGFKTTFLVEVEAAEIALAKPCARGGP